MIFICYSSKDRLFAYRIAEGLRSKAVKAWVDYEQLDLSKPLVPQIVRAVLDSHTICFLDSVHSRRSPWVCLELRISASANKAMRIFPVGKSAVAQFVRSITSDATLGVSNREYTCSSPCCAGGSPAGRAASRNSGRDELHPLHR